MAKRIPLSRASKDFYALLPKLRGISGERDIADVHASLCSPSVLRGLVSRMPGGSTLDPMYGFDDNPCSLEYIWMSRWAACKQVYRIDPEVADALKAQPLEGALPAAAIERLPYPIVYIDCPVEYSTGMLGGTATEQAQGFLAYIDESPENHAQELYIVYMHKQPDANGKTRHLVSIDLTFPTLDDALDAILKADQEVWDEEARSSGAAEAARQSEAERLAFTACTAQAVNLLLYVVSAENDAQVEYEPPRAARGQKAGRRTNPETLNVLGARIGRKIGEARRAVSSSASGSAQPSGRTVSPHIRRAHWQSYWVGPRKNRPDGRPGDRVVVKWIPPIEVNGAAPTTETVHESR